MQPRASISKKKYSVESTSSCFPLPPIISKGNSFIAATTSNTSKTYLPEKKQPASNQSSPLKKSEIDQIVEEAKRNRDKKNAIIPGERLKRTSKQLHDKSVLPHRNTNRKTYRQQVVTRSLVMGQSVPVSSVVIDLESNDAPAMLTGSESRPQLRLTDSIESLMQGQKSQSHSNLSAVHILAPRRNLLPTSMADAERSRRRTQGRIGSVSSSKSVPGVTVTKKKSLQDVRRLGATASQFSVSQMDKEWAKKTRYWGTSSKPLVKKIAFSIRPDSEISPHPLNSSSGAGDSDTNSVSDRGVATDDSTDTGQHLKHQQRLRQRATLPNRQPWRNQRRHGTLQHSSQLARTRYPFPSRKQLSLAKGSVWKSV